VELAFGLDKVPLGQMPSRAWLSSFERHARALRWSWSSKSDWPLWPALAVRYASFFLDFFFTSGPAVPASTPPTWLAELRSLAPEQLSDALRVLERWFAVPGIQRDNAGRPIYPNGPSNRPLFMPRTTLELLLLSGSPPSTG
jgi:hypothetical protein